MAKSKLVESVQQVEIGVENLISLNKKLQEQVEKLSKELEAEKKLNEEIKVRFVKCNTCTDEMKKKCLMFSENLCGGERCEELVDLMALISKGEDEGQISREQ